MDAGGLPVFQSASQGAAVAQLEDLEQQQRIATVASANAAFLERREQQQQQQQRQAQMSGRQPQPNLGRIPNVHHLQGGSQQN